MKLWITFNEPWIVAFFGYGNGVFPPGKEDHGRGGYVAAHNIIKAHAKVWRMYDTEFRHSQNG